MECRWRQQKTRQQKRQLLSGGANYESQTREMATAAHSKVGQWVSRCTGENVFFFFSFLRLVWTELDSPKPYELSTAECHIRPTFLANLKLSRAVRSSKGPDGARGSTRQRWNESSPMRIFVHGSVTFSTVWSIHRNSDSHTTVATRSVYV